MKFIAAYLPLVVVAMAAQVAVVSMLAVATRLPFAAVPDMISLLFQATPVTPRHPDVAGKC